MRHMTRHEINIKMKTWKLSEVSVSNIDAVQTLEHE